MNKLLCVPLFVGACVLLYFGSGMLLLVSGYPGEAYFATARVVYGVLPTFGGLGLLAVVGWLWDRSVDRGNLRRAFKITYLLATGAVTLFWLGLLVIGSRNQVP